MTHIYRAPMPPGVEPHPRKGQPCRVLVAADPQPCRLWPPQTVLINPRTGYSRPVSSLCAPRNCMIEFEDGHRTVTINPKKSLRPMTDRDRQMGLF